MTYTPPFTYQSPTDLREACDLLSFGGEGARIVAGGTDLLVRIKQGLSTPHILIDVKNIAELKVLSFTSDRGLMLGSGLLLRRIETDPLIAEMCPALALTASKVASYPIRWMGTLGGNLCQETMCWYYNQSSLWRHSQPECFKSGGAECTLVHQPEVCYSVYRGDLAVVLMALDAEVTLVSQKGERIVPLASLFQGKGEAPLAITPDEILTSILIPNPALNRQASYQKLSFRSAVDYPLASAAVSMEEAGPKNLNPSTARVTLGAMGPAPVRCVEAEKVLADFWGQEQMWKKLTASLKPYTHPVHNLSHGWPGYRREMAAVMVRRAVEELQGRTPSPLPSPRGRGGWGYPHNAQVTNNA